MPKELLILTVLCEREDLRPPSEFPFIMYIVGLGKECVMCVCVCVCVCVCGEGRGNGKNGGFLHK